MSQTLFAVLALAMAILLSLSVARSRISSEQTSTSQQATVYGTDAGLELLDDIRSRPFDAATAGAAPGDPLVPRTSLTPEPFATGTAYGSAADIDDFHGMPPHPMTVGGLGVQTTAEVRYVQEDTLTTASATPTYAKEVTVFVWSEAFPDTLRLTQVVTYP